jgi:hypothetical protein
MVVRGKRMKRFSFYFGEEDFCEFAPRKSGQNQDQGKIPKDAKRFRSLSFKTPTYPKAKHFKYFIFTRFIIIRFLGTLNENGNFTYSQPDGK